MKNKKVLINYTDRDFNSIKRNLEEHARLYYPESFRDFSENSFGSYILDTVSYVGDMLSFYLDYQVNESFLETAIEYENIRKKASQFGYNFFGRPAAHGLATIYVKVPANPSGLGPNRELIPVMKKGSEFTSDNGTSFILTEDIDFSNPKNDVVASTFSTVSGKPTEYAIRAFGQIRSTVLFRTTVDVGDFVKMRKVLIGPSSISAIHSVRDTEGHEYHQVKNLSQDTIYINTTNPSAQSDGIPEIIKPKIANRRFVMFQDSTGTYLQFGYGDSESVNEVPYMDPSAAALQMTGRSYISDTSFDPNVLITGNSLGVGPSNTTLTILFFQNEQDTINVAAGSLNSVGFVALEFPNSSLLSQADTASVRSSVEVSNETSIVGNTSLPSAEEIRYRAYAAHAAQDRAVTRNDYEAFCYLMPPQFGSVKRASIVNDPSSTNRRLSLYVISENSNGNLEDSNGTLKNNLSQWLNQNKMLNDNIDIYSAKIINIGFDYEIIVDPTKDKVEILNNANIRLANELADQMHIGEPFYLTHIYNILNKVDGVVDTTFVKPVIRSGLGYSVPMITIADVKSKDGTYLKCPKNAIYEIKNFNADVKGAAV